MRELAIVSALLVAPLSMQAQSAGDSVVRLPEEIRSVWGVFLTGGGLRFKARVLRVRTESFELIPRGGITRNGHTATLSDLRRGDDVVIHMISPRGRLASRIEAHSRWPE